MAKQEPEATEAAETAKYTKEQFIGSSKYAAHKDVLNALLVDGETYTTEQVDRQLTNFLKKEAK